MFLVSMAVQIVALAVFSDYLLTFYNKYIFMGVKLSKEKFFLDNCKDPTFFTKMKELNKVCFEVETNARIGAFWSALKEVSDESLYKYRGLIIGCAIVLAWICWPKAKAVIPIHSDYL
jgi:hypothetical protein